ncbi:MAG TPA: thioredoxin family protein [Psychromonas hadalis]|nr:thioredoxin family protein [Psychromonas hadalis]
MKNINVYGTGCSGCNATMEIIQQVADQKGEQVTLTKVSSLEEIMMAGVMSTPAISIDGNVIHSGSVPSAELVEKLLF